MAVAGLSQKLTEARAAFAQAQALAAAGRGEEAVAAYRSAITLDAGTFEARGDP